MKILIVSDSHGEWRILEKLVARERPDVVFHLGDYLGDAQKLSLACPGTPVEAVPGNCDGFFHREDTERILSYGGVRFLLTHGHPFRVKSGLDLLARVGREQGVDAVLFGHTHKALVEREGGLWLVNPGTAGGDRAPATYAIAEAERGEVRFELRPVESGGPKWGR